MAYYAIAHRYGASTLDERGAMIGTVVAFATRKARDAWVDAGPSFTHEPGAREPLAANGRTAKRARAEFREFAKPTRASYERMLLEWFDPSNV